MSRTICKLCNTHFLEDFFEKSMCMYCGEPFCAQCVGTEVPECPCCKKALLKKNDKSTMKSLLRIAEKFDSGEIENNERVIDHLYICIGGRYLKGQGVKADRKKAEKYYKRASKLGSPVADYNLYCIYYDMEKEDEYSIECLNRAVDAGYPKALCTKALSFKTSIEPKVIIRGLEMRSALSKKILYQYFKDHPESTTTDVGHTKESADLLRRSAKSKYHDALFEWAVAIQFGHLPGTFITREMTEEEVNMKIDENAKKSIFWYTLAAQQGHELAMNNLGVIYKNGLHGGMPNLEEAKKWYLASHMLGCKHGTFGMGTIWEEKGEELRKKRDKGIFSPEKIDQIMEEEDKCFREAGHYYGYSAQSAFTPAIFQLGLLMATRRLPLKCVIGENEIEYTETQIVKDGMILIKDAASQGNKHAQQYINKLFKEFEDE